MSWAAGLETSRRENKSSDDNKSSGRRERGPRREDSPRGREDPPRGREDPPRRASALSSSSRGGGRSSRRGAPSSRGDEDDRGGEEDDLVVLAASCCHIFHRGCLERWLRRKGHCPKCRAPVDRAFAEAERSARAAGPWTPPPPPARVRIGRCYCTRCCMSETRMRVQRVPGARPPIVARRVRGRPQRG